MNKIQNLQNSEERYAPLLWSSLLQTEVTEESAEEQGFWL